MKLLDKIHNISLAIAQNNVLIAANIIDKYTKLGVMKHSEYAMSLGIDDNHYRSIASTRGLISKIIEEDMYFEGTIDTDDEVVLEIAKATRPNRMVVRFLELQRILAEKIINAVNTMDIDLTVDITINDNNKSFELKYDYNVVDENSEIVVETAMNLLQTLYSRVHYVNTLKQVNCVKYNGHATKADKAKIENDYKSLSMEDYNISKNNHIGFAMKYFDTYKTTREPVLLDMFSRELEIAMLYDDLLFNDSLHLVTMDYLTHDC